MTVKRTQVDKLVAFIANNPGCSALDIIAVTRIAKYTGRISDARKQGHDIQCRTREDGQPGYWLMPKRPVTTGEQSSVWDAA